MILEQKELFRIGSKPALFYQFEATRKESFVIYFKKTHHPALGPFHNGAWVACRVESKFRIKYCILFFLFWWGVRSGTKVEIEYLAVHF